MKAFAAFLIFSFLTFSVCIPVKDIEDYKKSKIEYDALIAKLNATDPCQLVFECSNREECVNFPKCKSGEACPRTKCVPRKLCESAICPPGTECSEFPYQFLGAYIEPKYDFKPRINYVGNSEGIRPACVSRKVPSDGNICGENEEANNQIMILSEGTCSISPRFGYVQPLKGPQVMYCICKKGFVRDDISGECIDPSKCPKATKSPINFETKKTEEITKGAKTNSKKTVESIRLRNLGASIKAINMKQKSVNPIIALRRTTKDNGCPEGYICSVNMKDFPDDDEWEGPGSPPPLVRIKLEQRAKAAKSRFPLFTNKIKIFTKRPINYASKNDN